MNATTLINGSSVSDIISAMNNESSSSLSSQYVQVPTAPTWMVEFIAFRQRLFLLTVEPIIVQIVGPLEDEIIETSWLSTSMENETGSVFGGENNLNHRRLGFLPDYVENASSVRETSMSFSTLITLFVTMSCILLILLSCFYHNQKTSPLFISPRRHRLPKLVPPPLPVAGYFDWVSNPCCRTDALFLLSTALLMTTTFSSCYHLFFFLLSILYTTTIRRFIIRFISHTI